MPPSTIIITCLPAYSDTGYSDIPATVTVFWSMKGSPFTENPGYSDIPLTVTLFCRPNPPNAVTVSGEACTKILTISYFYERFLRTGCYHGRFSNNTSYRSDLRVTAQDLTPA